MYIFRGHTVKAVCESFHMSKDAGFKVVSHMMPDLPNVGLERDIEQFIVSTDFNKAIKKFSSIFLFLYKMSSVIICGIVLFVSLIR